MKAKKILVLMLVLALVGSFTIGCGGNNDGGGGGGDVVENGGGDSADKAIVMKYAHTDSDVRSNNLAALAFKEFMEANADGKVIVEVYPNEQLGDDQELVKGLQLGTVHFYTGASANLGGVFGEVLDVLDLPFLYDGYDSWYEGIFDNGAGDIYNELLADTGLYNITYMYDSARCVNNNVRPIYKVEDMKNIKMRCMSSNMYISIYEAMGSNPTPMSFGEVYTGLAQGTIEGQDNPPGLTCDKKFYEVTKYYSLTRHTISPAPVTTSMNFLESLPADLYDIVIEGIEKTSADQRVMEYERELEYIKEIDDSGCAVNEISDLDGFREAVKPVYDKWRDIVGDDVVDRLVATSGV